MVEMQNGNTGSLSLIDGVNIQQVTASMQNITRFQHVVQKTLKQNHDFGVIPGTPKPTLLKPGAEKILMLMGLTSEYDILEKVEDYDNGIFAYIVKCTLLKGDLKVTEGLGACNSKEDKYRWRWVYDSDLPPGSDKESLKKKVYDGVTKYRVENEDICNQANTILKMAKKRAQIDATLTVAALSEIFTQDLEDTGIAPETEVPQSIQQKAQPQQKKQNDNQATEAQLKKLYATVKELGLEKEAVQNIMQDRYGKSSSKDLTKKEASDLIEFLSNPENIFGGVEVTDEDVPFEQEEVQE